MRMILISNKSFKLSLEIHFLMLLRRIKLSSEIGKDRALTYSRLYATVGKNSRL